MVKNISVILAFQGLHLPCNGRNPTQLILTQLIFLKIHLQGLVTCVSNDEIYQALIYFDLREIEL